MKSNYKKAKFGFICFLALCLNGYSADFFTPENEYILQIRLKEGPILSNSLIAYPDNNRWYVELIELSNAFGYQLKFSTDLKQITGYLINSNDSINIDLDSCEVNYRRKNSKFNCEMIMSYEESYYVSHEFVEEFLNADLNIQKNQLRVIVDAKDKILPLRKFLRDKKQITQKNKSEKYPGHELVPLKDKFIDGYNIDQKVQYQTKRNRTSDTSNLEYVNQTSFGVMGFENELYVQGGSTRETTWLLKSEKYSEDGGVLGFINAKSLKLYHYNVPSEPLLGGGELLKGSLITNFSKYQAGFFGSRDFNGILKPGWEVELYQNDILIDKFDDNGSGRYQFKNIALNYGVNNFKTIFYGPNGEEITKYNTFEINSNLRKEKDLGYQFYLGKDENNENAFGLKLSQALDFGLTANMGFHDKYLDKSGKQHQYASIGINGSLNSLSYSIDTIKNLEEGSAFQTKMIFPFKGMRLNTKYTQLSEFRSSEFNNNTSSILTDKEFESILFVPIPTNPRIIMRLGHKINALNNNYHERSFTNDIVMNYKKLSLNNNLSINDTNKTWNDDINLRYRFGRTLLKLSGKIQKEKDLTNVLFEVKRSNGRLYNFKTLYNRDILNNNNILSLSGSKLFNKFKVFGLFSYETTQDEFAINIGADFSLSHDHANKKILIQGEKVADKGNVLVTAFIDKNHNKILDKDEKRLENVAIHILQRDIAKYTNSNGNAFFNGLPKHTYINVKVQEKSLNSINLRPLIKGQKFWSRPGNTQEVFYPLGYFGEIEGNINYKSSNILRPAHLVKVTLVLNDNTIIKETYSDRDGYYYFENVVPGRYLVRIDSKGIDYQQDVIIPEEGDLITLKNINISK